MFSEIQAKHSVPKNVSKRINFVIIYNRNDSRRLPLIINIKGHLEER